MDKRGLFIRKDDNTFAIFMGKSKKHGYCLLNFKDIRTGEKIIVYKDPRQKKQFHKVHNSELVGVLFA